MKKLFISYRREDTNNIVGRIYDRLADRFGPANVFKDVEGIALGIDYRDALREAVQGCDVLLAVIGKGWLDAVDKAGRRRLDIEGDFVRVEIESALERKIPVIPLMVDGTAVPTADLLPASLANLSYRNGMPVRYDPDFHPDVDRLIAALGRMQPSREASPKLNRPSKARQFGWGTALLMACLGLIVAIIAAAGTWYQERPDKREPSKKPADIGVVKVAQGNEPVAPSPPISGDPKLADVLASPIGGTASSAPPMSGDGGVDKPVSAKTTAGAVDAAPSATEMGTGPLIGNLFGLPPLRVAADCANLHCALEKLVAAETVVKEQIGIGLWFGDSVSTADIEALMTLASAQGDSARLVAMAYEGINPQDFLHDPVSAAEATLTRVTDGRKLLDDKRVDTVILVGFLRSGIAPSYLPKRIDPLPSSRLESTVVAACQAGRDVYVLTSSSDTATWDPHSIHRREFADLAEAWAKLGVVILKEQDNHYALLAAHKFRRIVWQAGPSVAEFEGFLKCVRSRDDKGAGDIKMPCGAEK